MALLEGKTSTERNKMIAAAVLGIIALVALYLAFVRPLFNGSSTTASTKSTPTPKPTATPAGGSDKFKLPTSDEDALNMTVPVVYQPGSSYAPDAGRNIFAFYEPPPPCKGPDCPTPTPKPTPPPTAAPTPPPPPMQIAAANPGNVYAGSSGFRLEIDGNNFTPDSHIYFNQTEMPTTFVSPQKLYTDIPANLVAQEGQRSLIIQTSDGRLYSDQRFLYVQPPPKPGYTYIGMIARKRYNNDTAYFTETGKDKPFGARLNDVLGGRFRLVDISAAEVVFEDVNLGFKHRLPISKMLAGGGTGGNGQPSRPNAQPDGGFPQFDPNQQNIPGIPNSIPRYVPPQQIQPQDLKRMEKEKMEKADVDDNGDG
jgi:hypothetical protein